MSLIKEIMKDNTAKIKQGSKLGNYDPWEHLSRCMGKQTICIGENKGADQLRSNCEADPQ